MMHVVHALALHPDIQRKAQDEIDQFCGEEVNYSMRDARVGAKKFSPILTSSTSNKFFSLLY